MKLFSLFLILFLFTIPTLSQTTINIPADYPTIQQGIDAAMDGDIVLVADGTYYENINFKGKAITVTSNFFIDGNKSHIENTIIDGSQPSNPDSASVVEFNTNEDSTSVLCGLKITGGSGTNWGYYIYGGGIILTDASPIIRNNIIEYNTLRSETTPLAGSAIALGLYSDKKLIIENNEFRYNLCQSTNTTNYINGTIYIHQTRGTVIFRNNNIHHNTIDGEYITNGGAISGFGNNSLEGTLTIENNIITSNVVEEGSSSSAQLGGGIFLEAYIAHVRNNIIAFNKANGGGGFWYYTPSALPQIITTLENNLIYGNAAGSRQGGGVSTHHDYEIVNCIVWGNTTPQFNYQQIATINWSNLEEAYPIGSNNISIDPEFLSTDTLSYFLLSDTSPCIDMGNPDPMYNDIEDPSNPGFALYPAQGTLINDIGHFGGPHSNWANLISDTLYVPNDFASIQEAINAAVDGNTILVADGTYYENINYKGKAITVASHFLVDGDSTHIENTIIDGSQAANPDSASVVYFTSGEGVTSVLAGFTITGGSGTYGYINTLVRRIGGGICAINSGATIKNNIIEMNLLEPGGDIWIGGAGVGANSVYDHNFIIEDNVIQYNSISTVSNNWVCAGGGIDIISRGYVSIRNNKILNNSISGPYAYGGGMHFNDGGTGQASFYIESNLFSGNIVNATNNGGSGGVDVYLIVPVMRNNLFVNNSALNGGAMFIENATDRFDFNARSGNQILIENGNTNSQLLKNVRFFENNTLVNNSATIAGGGLYILGTSPQIINFIVWGNTAPTNPQISGSADVQYSDIEGGYSGDGNIDADPQFDPNSAYYLMQSSSLCIDAGHSDPIYNDLEDPNNSGYPWAPAQGTLRNDMGHCGGPASLWPHWDWPMPVNEEASVLSDYVLFQNYPNPFNPTTTIKYAVPERSRVELKVYDILGNEVASLTNEEQNEGNYELNFNAVNLSSGVYFYQLKAGQFTETKKMLLLK